MTHPYYHAESSVRKFGGEVNDYIEVHNWLDFSKQNYCDFRHRLLRHHAQGIFEAEREFGYTITNSDGKKIPVRYIAEQHILEDLGKIPTLADWLSKIKPEAWMSRGTFVHDSKED